MRRLQHNGNQNDEEKKDGDKDKGKEKGDKDKSTKKGGTDRGGLPGDFSPSPGSKIEDSDKGDSKPDAKKKIAYGYPRSIKEALTTEYPEGMVYILQNVLEELDRFDLDFPPSRKQGNQRSPLKPADRDIIDINQTDDDVRGFPNQTNLKEAIYMAQDLSQEWSGLNYTEKSDAMGRIRARIQEEDMWLDWHKIPLTEG